MAINVIEYFLFRTMRDQGAFPLGMDILQLGEANWYGDVDIHILVQDIYRYVPEGKRKAFHAHLDEVIRAKRNFQSFEIAKVFWDTFLAPSSMTAIDFHGTESALKLDLNTPFDLGRRFDCVMNIGTAEHVFNIGQVFRTIHAHTLPGGIMIHDMPFTGWVDHGFYNFNPTFYWDIAQANQYKIMAMFYSEMKPIKILQLNSREQIHSMAQASQLGANSMIYTVFKKSEQDQDLIFPIQGYYAGSISTGSREAWRNLR